MPVTERNYCNFATQVVALEWPNEWKFFVLVSANDSSHQSAVLCWQCTVKCVKFAVGATMYSVGTTMNATGSLLCATVEGFDG